MDASLVSTALLVNELDEVEGCERTKLPPEPSWPPMIVVPPSTDQNVYSVEVPRVVVWVGVVPPIQVTPENVGVQPPVPSSVSRSETSQYVPFVQPVNEIVQLALSVPSWYSPLPRSIVSVAPRLPSDARTPCPPSEARKYVPAAIVESVCGIHWAVLELDDTRW